MANQYVLMAIAIGLFFAGLAAGYGLFIPAPSHMSAASQQQMPNGMMQDTQIMNQTQFREQVIENMKQNHDFTQGMIMDMMNDPQIRSQMIGHMLENQEFMQQMQQAIGNQTSSGSGMEMMG